MISNLNYWQDAADWASFQNPALVNECAEIVDVVLREMEIELTREQAFKLLSFYDSDEFTVLVAEKLGSLGIEVDDE